MWRRVKAGVRRSPAVVSMIWTRRRTAEDDQREREQRSEVRGGAETGEERRPVSEEPEEPVWLCWDVSSYPP